MQNKILIVDDEENVCIFIKDAFERRGFGVLTALSAEEAVDIFKKHKPQICLIDIHLPFSEFDGIEVLKKIKEIDRTTTCIMVTRIDDEVKKEKAKELGAFDYLLKPLRITVIEDIIDEVARSMRK